MFSAPREKKEHDISTDILEWSQSKDHLDMHDRRYYPTPTDIQYISGKIKMLSRNHANDALSVESLVKSDIQSDVLHYQPLSRITCQPFIVLQTKEQQSELKECGKNLVFMDASYSGMYVYVLYF